MPSLSSFFKITPQKRIYYGGMLIMFLVVSLFLFPSDLFIQLGIILVGGFLFFLFLFNLEWGLYLLVATSIFYGWEIYFSQYEAAKNIAYLAAINAPLVDLVTLVLGGSTALAWLLQLRHFDWRKLFSMKKILGMYSLFVMWCVLAAYHAGPGQIGSSLKYLFRPIIFAFLGFVILPMILIQKKETLWTALKVAFWTGISTALFGLSSIIVAPQAGWIRVEPYGIGNFAPLGYNHNMIAEALVIFIPVAGYLAWQPFQKRNLMGKVYFAGLLLMLLVALLTLSRAAWLSLIAEAIMVFIFFRQSIITYISRKKFLFAWLGLVGGVALLGYMAVFLTSSVVSSSDSARWQMVDITLFYTKRSPWFGRGPGTYTDILGSTLDYVAEHGDPVDSHGFIQKVLLEEGVIGLLLFSLVIFLIFYWVWRSIDRDHVHKDRLLIPALFIMMVGGVVFQLFDTSYFKSVMWLPMGLGIAASFLEREDTRKLVQEG